MELLHQLEAVKQQLGDVQQHNAGLCGRVDELVFELEGHQNLSELRNKTIKDLESTTATLTTEKQELQQELVSLETALLVKMAAANGCSGCADQDTDRCPGPDLCGKTILYVGGHNNLVPRYRQLVEKFGGHFVHHDGGREVSRAVLQKMLSSADAVLCPRLCQSRCLQLR